MYKSGGGGESPMGRRQRPMARVAGGGFAKPAGFGSKLASGKPSPFRPVQRKASGGGGGMIVAGLQAGQKGTKVSPAQAAKQSGKALADRKKQTSILGNM